MWVRGYGLVDSAKVKGRPGDTALNLTAVVAPTPADAAKVYPGNYWLSLLQPPPKSAFPGTGEKGNGIPPAMDSQAHWIYNIKSGCNFCHELGTQITRTLGHMDHLGFKTPEEAWVYRTQLGVRGSAMAGTMAQWGTQAGAKVLADWTTRIAQGEIPPQPPRPAGAEAITVAVANFKGGVTKTTTALTLAALAMVWSAARQKVPEGTALLAWFGSLPVLCVLLCMNLVFFELLRELVRTAGAPEPGRMKFTLITVLLICVQPAVVEELFFRQMALGVLRRHMNVHLAIWVTGAVFALAHLGNIIGMPYLFLVGAFLGYARVYGGLTLAMVLHFLHTLAVVAYDACRPLG